MNYKQRLMARAIKYIYKREMPRVNKEPQQQVDCFQSTNRCHEVLPSRPYSLTQFLQIALLAGPVHGIEVRWAGGFGCRRSSVRTQLGN